MTPNIHHSSTECTLLLCTAGKALVTINGQSFHAIVGSVLVISPMALFVNVEDGAEWVQLTIDSHTAIEVTRHATSAIQSLGLLNHPFIQLDQPTLSYFLDIHRRIQLRQRELQNCSAAERTLLELSVRNLQQAIVFELTLQVSRKVQVRLSYTKEEMLLSQFVPLLMQNYRRHRNVAWYANQLHISPRYFAGLITRVSGYSPSKWICRVVIFNAKILLGQPDARVKDVAAELGFPEQFTFRKYFKHYTGTSPKEYIKTGCNNTAVSAVDGGGYHV